MSASLLPGYHLNGATAIYHDTATGSELVYNGPQAVMQMVAAGGGVDTLFSGGKVYFSPDGRNLAGSGTTVLASGNTKVREIAGVANGVDTLFNGGKLTFSPDGRNLGGGGNTVSAYNGTQNVVSMQAFKGGVLTLFDQGGLYLSSNGLYLGGGASTTRMSTTNITSFSVEPNGNRVFALRSDGLLMYSTLGYAPYFASSASGVKSFSIAPSGRVYALRTDGLLMFSDKGYAPYFSTSATGIRSFQLSPSGRVYALTGDGQLMFSDLGYAPYFTTSTTGVKYYSVAPSGRVYVLRNDGLLMYSDQGFAPYFSTVDKGIGDYDLLDNGTLDWVNSAGLVYSATYQTPFGKTIIGSGVTTFAIAADGNLRMTNGAGASFEQTSDQWTFGVDHPAAARAYAPFQGGTLFGPTGGPSYQDVRQGASNDCWLTAALAEAAAREPGIIKSMFTKVGTAIENGSTVCVYTVRLYDADGTPKKVVVDTELPGGNNTRYDHPAGNILWAALAEKAYIQANGMGIVGSSNPGLDSYALDGAWPAQAMQGITGNGATTKPMQAVSATEIFNDWQKERLIVVDTPPATNPLTLGSQNVVALHAYAIVGYDETTETFTMYSPWGIGADPDYPAIITGTASQIAGVFTSLDVG